MPTKTPTTTRGHEFTQDEIDRALTALALNSGNSYRAREALKLDSTLERLPSDRVLRQWKAKHATRYHEIRTKRAPDIEAAAVQDYRAIVAATNEAHLELVEHARDGIEDLTAYEASAAAKNLAIAGGVAADKLLVFTDRPNQITERRDPEQILRQLETFIGTAEDITDPEPSAVALLPESAESNPRETRAGASS